MNKYSKLVTLLALLLAMSALPLWGQSTGTAKGMVKDQTGKPMDGATIELSSPDTGRKVELKTNSKGEYQSIAIPPGTYDFSLIKDGQLLDKVMKVPVMPGDTRIINFDLSQHQGTAGPTPEQQKQIEAVQKHNEKIKTLNAVTDAGQATRGGG